MYAALFAVVLPVLAVALLGYVWSLAKLAYDESFVSSFVMNIAAPCLLLAAIIKQGLPATELWYLTGITLLGLVFLFLASAAFICLCKKDQRTYLGPLAFTNTANMGIPVSLLALGEEAALIAIVIFMVTSIVQFSLGIAIVNGKNALSTMFKAPLFYATLAAFIVVGFDLNIADPIVDTLEMVGATAIPLMLISLGVSLQSLEVKDFKTSLLMSVFRIASGFCIGILICELLSLEGIIRGVVIIQAAMPSAVASYMIARKYQQQAKEVAGVVVVSTVLSFLTMPLLLGYVMS